MPQVKFVVSVKDAKPGDKVFVVGGPTELGNWKTTGATELTTGPGFFPRWSIEVEIEARSFEYKYIWQHSNGASTWESIPNRTYLGVEGRLKEDGEFNHNECVQKPGSCVYFHGYYAHADWAQEKFAKLEADLTKMRATVDTQAKELAQQDALLKTQDALLVKQGEVVKKQRDLLEDLQAKLKAQNEATERLRRELSDFRAEAPEEEEIREKVLAKIHKDIPEILASLLSGIHGDAKEGSQEEPLEGVEEFEDRDREEEPPREIQADVRAQDARQPDNPKEEKAFAMKTSGWADCSALFEYPPHPEGEAGEKTRQVLQTLMSKFSTGTKEEKEKLLKMAPLRLHPDKGGSKEAMHWWDQWKPNNEEWYLKGPESNLLEKQQPAG